MTTRARVLLCARQPARQRAMIAAVRFKGFRGMPETGRPILRCAERQ